MSEHEHHHHDEHAQRARSAGRRWEIIVEPDVEESLLVVITAYPLNP
jgi:hypothetical protein